MSSDNSMSKMYYFISDGVKQEPLKLWKVMFLVLLLVICIVCTSSLWATNVFWLTVRKFTALENNSLAFRYFEQPPAERMDLCVHVYNYTNVDQFYSENAEEVEDQLGVEFLGPYCFKEIPQKVNSQFQDHQHKLSYQEASSFVFDPDFSNGTLSDIIVVPNFPYLVTTSLTADFDFFTRSALSFYIRSNGYRPFIRLNTSDFFLGYDDPLLERLAPLASLKKIKVPFTRFGLIDALMSFINVEMTVNTGIDDVTQIGKVARFKGKENMTFWKTPECNQYQGGEGLYWDVDEVQAGRNMKFFALLLCQNMEVRKIGDVEFVKGAKVPRYELIPDMFHSDRPDYDCYCKNCTTNILDISECLEGFPFKTSFPKFWGVDPGILSHLKNLPEPDDNGWSSLFDIHPYLGTTLRFTQRLQLNLHIRKASSSSLPPKLQNGQLLPTVSLERQVHNLRSDANALMYHALTTLPILEASLRYGGLLIVLYLSYVLMRNSMKCVNI